MSVASDLRELESVNRELELLNKEITRLRRLTIPLKAQVEKVNDRIIAFCQSRDHAGVKYKGKAILVENKPGRGPKKESMREEDAVRVLKSRGIENAEQVYKEMMEARRGELTEKSKLKIKTLSN
jgi:hypothetical protein